MQEISLMLSSYTQEKYVDNITFVILLSTVKKKSLSTRILQMQEAGHMCACVKDKIYPLFSLQ
jgi:hypothetical protein